MQSLNKMNYRGTEYKFAGDELDQKADMNGYYDELTAGSAAQLIANVQVEDQRPYSFRATGDTIDA